MNASVHAPYCADESVQLTSSVRELELLARDTYRIRVDAPQIAAQTIPGQFVMIRLAGISDPLIGRALAVYDVFTDGAGRPQGIDLVFVAKGKFTTALVAAGREARVSLWGPLGNAFDTTPVDHLIMAVGGIGQTPMLLLGDEALGNRRFGMRERRHGYARRATLVYGARSGDLLAGLEAFSATGMELRLCTDDGSRGQRGRVPEVLAEILDELRSAQPKASLRVVTCGPEIMMEKVSEVTARRDVPCQVSLETPMACGIGICFSCVAKVRQEDGQWDYKRTCVEGPIFDAARIVW
jgi:dihydroorotate dehydrogenase electron transfer subunit